MTDKLTEAFRRFEIGILTHLTAGAFERKSPSLKGLSAGECLERYRDFTVLCLKGRSREELARCRRRLYLRAFRLGRLLAALPGMGGDKRKKALIRFLYKNIAITIQDEADGAGRLHWYIVIPVCYFSRVYRPGVCYVMSGLDAGIICGLFGGGSLHFTQRLTEGCEACKAIYSGGET